MLHKEIVSSPYLTIRELADYLKVAEQTVRNNLAQWASEGLKVVKVRGIVRIRTSDFEKWIEKKHTVKVA
jgi:excisionase family DNA binding protein